jgi:DNA-binding response OmpR family regulator
MGAYVPSQNLAEPADTALVTFEVTRPAIKILIVEDDAVCARMLMGVLRRRGYAVVAASDGVQAMRVARIERPDVILLDIGLPGGDGLVTLTRLRNLSETALTPVVISTSRPASEIEGKARELGADEFLSKPVEPDLLTDAIDRLTHRAR